MNTSDQVLARIAMHRRRIITLEVQIDAAKDALAGTAEGRALKELKQELRLAKGGLALAIARVDDFYQPDLPTAGQGITMTFRCAGERVTMGDAGSVPRSQDGEPATDETAV